jgi:exodeoxyribonuclease VII small subunit
MAIQNKRSDQDMTRAAMPSATEAAKFEDRLSELEAIVAQIDSGELSLEESISSFERGVSLVRSLNRQLDEVERRVEVLMRTGDGELKSAPYEGPLGDSGNGGATNLGGETVNGGEKNPRSDAVGGGAKNSQSDAVNGGAKNSNDDEDIPF